MKTRKQIFLLTLIAVFTGLALLATAAQAQSTPHVYTTDLQSGPNSGGQGSQGAWVTVYGNGFGATRGTSQVTIGGVAAYSYGSWSDTKISFQLGSTAVTGNINVKVAGVSSNGVPFSVRAGNIYFVSPSGNDSRQGNYSRPWKTLSKALSTAQAGDIVYVMNGFSAANVSLVRSGTANAPIALVAYPGATATIGSTTGSTTAVTGGNYSYFVLAGMTLRGAPEAVNFSGTNWRLAGNDISCPNGSGAGACVHASAGSQHKLLANNIHDSGVAGAASYASVQLSASNVEFGWNTIANTRSCRALTFYSGSTNQYGITVHDNYIHDAVCDGISLTTVDPSKGAVQAYNNIVQRAGTGPAPGGSEQAYACIRTHGSGQGTVQILNNTLYDCGARANADSGAIAAATPTNASNNIVSVSSNEAYVDPNTSTANLQGSNNIFWGPTYVPAPFTDSQNIDPQFIDPASAKFALQPTSPAIDAGMMSGVSTDYLGVTRPTGGAYDIGALEFTGTKGNTNIGQLTQNPSALDFGSITVGTSTTQSVTVTNTGNANATISQMNVTGAGFSATGMTLPLTLSAGQSTTFTVTFAPTTAGNASGSVALISNASNSTSTVQLTGTSAAAVGSLSASTSSLAFGSVTVGNTATQNVTVTASTASVTISNASVSGAGYSITGLTLPTTLTAGQSATFQVKFAPTTSGATNGTVTLTSNASNPSTSISLAGTGATTAGTLAANPTSLSFGSINTGTSTSQNVTVTASTASVTISNASVSGAGYSVTGLTLPLTLTAGQSATFQVKFAPTAAGTVNGTVTLTSNASNPSTSISLTGTGTTPVGTLAANPTSVNFGARNTGTTSTNSVTLTAGTASVTISNASVAGAGYSISGLTLPTTLAAGQSATFTVAFTPTVAGTANGTVTLTSNASNPTLSIALTGTGATPPPPSHSATLNWSASTSTGIAGYNVYRSTTSGSGYSKITPTAVSGMSLIDTSVGAGTTYYYVVTAVDSTGTESSYSSQATASVPTP